MPSNKTKKDFLLYDTVNENFIIGINQLFNEERLREKLHKNLLSKSTYLDQNKLRNRFIKVYFQLFNKNNPINNYNLSQKT